MTADPLSRFRSALTQEAVRRGTRRKGRELPQLQNRRQSLSPEQEMKAILMLKAFVDRLTPRVRFNKKGIGNGFELYRRHCISMMFLEFEMRRTDDEMRDVFQSIQGNVSMAAFFCAVFPPPAYLLWFYEGMPRHSLANLSEKALRETAQERPEYAEVVRTIIERMRRHRAVEGVLKG